MPAHLKKLVRARMAKTGESYATALRYVRRKAERRTPPVAEPPAARRYRYRGTVRRDPAIDAYVRSEKGALGEILERLVSLVRSSVPQHDELAVHGSPHFCVESEPFCYVVGYAKHVNLGFCDGSRLADPDGLLEGTGKTMRHVKLRPGLPVPAAALARMIRDSARLVRARQAADRREARDARR
jgi:hypothetical protein